MALFKILKGNEANLPSSKHEGWAYVTEKGNMYVDLSADRRVKIGNRADSAEYADKATGDTKTIREKYLAKIKQVTSNGTTFTFRGETGDGSNAADLITIPLAGDKAGLISNAAQTIKGVKTFNNGISFPDVSSTAYPAKSVGLTWSGSTDGAKIYYEVQASDKGMLILESSDDGNAGVIFRNSSSGKTVSIINGIVTGAFTGNLNGTANNAISDNAGKTITSYVHSVTKKSPTVFTVTKGDGTVNDIALEFLPTAGGTVHGELYADSITAGSLIVTGVARFTNGLLGNLTGNVTGNVTGNLTGTATNATKDAAGNIITNHYIHKIIKVTSNGTTFTFRGQAASGDNLNDLITIPAASTSVAGLITNAAQTLAGLKTFSGGITVSNTSGFTYSGIETASGDSARPIWFAHDTKNGTPVINASKFTYNPSTNTLVVGNIKLNGLDIANNYLVKIKQVTSDGTTFSFRGETGDGSNANDLITIPVASTSKAGLITTGAQTIAGEKTLNNNLYFANVSTTANTTGKTLRGVYGSIGDNDGWRIAGGATASDSGFVEIATCDNGSEPIYVRQYSGGGSAHSFTTLVRTLTLLDASGNTRIPGSLYDKNSQELRANLFLASLFQKTSNGTTFTFGGKSTDGSELSAITIPNASATVAGLITNGAQTLAGDKTFTGQLKKAGVPSSWIGGRDNAFIRMTSISGYSPAISIKTTNGSWDIGAYNHSSYTDDLIFSYCTDANYNAGNNTTTAQIKFLENGHIVAALDGNASTATKATQDDLGQKISSTYVKSVALKSGSNYIIQVVKGDGTTSEVSPKFASSSSCGGAADSANILNGHIEQNVTTNSGNGKIRYSYNVNHSTVGLFPAASNANGILTVSKHGGDFYSQLGFSSNGKLYYRSFHGVVLDTTTAWKQIAFTDTVVDKATQAEKDFSGNLITSYVKTVTLKSGSHHVIRVTKGDGTTNDIALKFLPTSGGTITGELYADSITAGSLVVTGVARFVNGLLGNLTGNVTGNVTGNLTGTATNATKDAAGNIITNHYIHKIVKVTSDGSTFTFRGQSASGDNLNDLITIPAASASVAGLVTNGAQTLAGNKTFTGLTTFSTAKGFNYSGIQDAVTESANRGIWFSDNTTKGIPVMNATKFNYNPGTDTLTVGNIKLNGSDIAATYIKSLTLVNNATAPTYTLTKGDGTTSSVGFPIASETYAGLVTAGDQSFAGTKRFNGALTLGAWNATIKCATWSRVCYIPFNIQNVGSGYIIQIQGTRSGVVYNQTFSVSVSRYQKGCITALSGTNYSSIQVRVVVDIGGNSYFEVYDNAKEVTNATTQTVHCRIIGISSGAITKYTSFTDGSTIPSDFVVTTLNVDCARSGLQTKYVTADDIKAGTLKVTGTITDKNGNEIAAALFVRTIAQKSISTSAYTIKGVNSAGDEITALTLPNATTAQAGLMTAVDQTFAGKKTFTNHTYIKYGVANLYIHSTSTAADSYSIIRLGTSSGENGGYIFLNGPSRTGDGGANLMTIRNNFGNLRLNNHTVVTNTLTVNQATAQTSNALYVNGTARIKSTNDSPNSQTTTASMIVDGGMTVMKQVSAKSVRIDNNDTAKGCTVKFNETGNYIEFVFD